jgi:2',3'-cyclic-nucleotide 2'-phosphodiesterase/3'-nucleotidase
MADSVIGGVHFVQPRNWAQAATVTHVSLVREDGQWRVGRVRGEVVELAAVPPSPRLSARLGRAHDAVRAWAAAPIGEAEQGFDATFARAEDTPIIDFVNAEQRAATGAQLSATAAFNTAGGFAVGPIRLRDVAALYPYENTLRMVRISGAALRAYLERSAAFFSSYPSDGTPIDPAVPGYNFDIVSGVEYVIDLSQPVGSRIRELRYDERPVEPSDTFTLALNSYRQAGGGGFTMFDGLPVVYDRGENIRDLLVDAVRMRKVLSVADDFVPSWTIEPAEAAAWVREHFTRSDRQERR